MSEMQTPYRDPSYPIRGNSFLKSWRDGLLGYIIAFVLFLAIGAVAVAVISQETSELLFLTILAILAVVGVFALFATALGVLHFGERVRQDDLTKAYADFLNDGLLITDNDGEVLYANETYSGLIGAQPDQAIPTLEQAFSGNPILSEPIFRLVRSARQGQAWEEEFRLPDPSYNNTMAADGVVPSRWFRVNVGHLPITKRSGRIVQHTFWRVAEITGDRLRQEEAFQKLQEAIQYLDYAPAGFFSADDQGQIDYMNATLAQWLGLDLAATTTGKLTLSDILPGDGRALLARPGGGYDTAETYELNIDLIRADGTSLPTRLLHRMTQSPDGAYHSRTMVLNRSPGAETAENLRAAEVRFARFYQSAPISIAMVSQSGQIGSTNAAFARMFGTMMQGSDQAQISIYDLIAPEERDGVAQSLRAAVAGQVDIAPVDISFGKDGERKGRLFISPTDQGQNRDEAAILYSIDTTEQKALEVQIAQSQKMQAVGQLAGGIAHDFNNVLTAIIGFSDLLLANHRPTDPAFKDIMNIKQNGNRAAGLVRQLLAFSRQQTLRPEVLSLTDVISDLSILLSRLLGEKVKLKVIHGRDLWFVKADIHQFEQVIINLAVNARDAMGDGGQLTIRTANVSERQITGSDNVAVERGEYVLLEVSDSGCGIPEDIMAKIFDPFFSTKEVGKGTGLGLSTVYGIVKQTGGYIFPESEPGKGTTFRIYLPRHVDESRLEADSETETAAKADKRDKPRDMTGSGCVLLVEDEEAVRSFAARALTSRGYKVLEAASGREALSVIEGHEGQVDLIVSDVVMPEMDGPTLLKEVRKTNKDLKIIFISGYAEDAFRKNLGDDEKFMFLPKPFSLRQLAGAVKEVFEQSE